ncbi:hypothetical protein K470DRAFT_174362 [Piedraia hortae CBS 480.64]|uniref:Uncharacterized protein n=1 Tax=Piedraia hortae CBS 480.64 TaxID=1314780 RepID=A0A6A7C648_9PEZI|nr:hypothetical protein K470DRAFT_174362 [Piedraia hortae CBS 480.64]
MWAAALGPRKQLSNPCICHICHSYLIYVAQSDICLRLMGHQNLHGFYFMENVSPGMWLRQRTTLSRRMRFGPGRESRAVLLCKPSLDFRPIP